MSQLDLIRQKNDLILELEQLKLAKATRAVLGRVASKAAVLESEIARSHLDAGQTEKAVVNLISQASCYIDARRNSEARRVFEAALSFTASNSTKQWLQARLGKLVEANRISRPFLSLKYDIVENTALRRPQRESYRACISHFSSSREHAIIQLPVGCGKTGVMSILPFGLSEGRVLVVAPNLEIRRNLRKNFDYSKPDCFWRKAKVLSNGDAPSCAELDSTATVADADNSDIVVTNIQQLVAAGSEKWLSLLPHDYFDMILIDEAHHNVAPSWQQVIARFHSARVASFTATPIRSDGQVVEGKRIYRFPIAEAIREGYIKDIASHQLNPSDILFEYRGQKKRHTLDEVLKLREEQWFSKGVALSAECNKNIVDASIHCMNDLRSKGSAVHQIIAVACSIDHANSIRSLFTERGLKADVLHSHLEEQEQERVRKELADGSLDAIVHVQMLSEGADYPRLSVAAIFRPFRHLVPYVQFVGRIMRVLVPNSPGHPDNKGYVVSHVGLNVDRWWEDLRRLDSDDQEFFEDISGGKREFLLEREPGVRRKFSADMQVLQETIAYFVQERLLPEDRQALVDDLIEAISLRGISLEALGLTRAQLEERYLEAQPSKVGSHSNLPVQPQAARIEARKRLDERVRSGAKQLLNELQLAVTGFDLPKRYGGSSNNLAAAVILLNKEVMKFLSVSGGERVEMTEEELKRAHDSMDILIDHVVQSYKGNAIRE